MAPTVKTIKGKRLITPKGYAKFVSAPAASQFDDTKQEASVVLAAEEGLALIAQLSAFIDENAKGLEIDAKVAKANIPIVEDLDADKNPTGFMRLKSKTGLKYPARFVDHNLKPFTPGPDFQVTNGSTIALSVTPELIKTSQFSGITLRLNGIQVIDLATNDLGFGEEDGSFEAAPTPPQDDGDDLFNS